MLATRFSHRSPSFRSREPIPDATLRAVAPSIFAEAKHSGRSDRYTYIPTFDILAGLRKEGFEPFMVCQTRVRAEGMRDASGLFVLTVWFLAKQRLISASRTKATFSTGLLRVHTRCRTFSRKSASNAIRCVAWRSHRKNRESSRVPLLRSNTTQRAPAQLRSLWSSSFVRAGLKTCAAIYGRR